IVLATALPSLCRRCSYCDFDSLLLPPHAARSMAASAIGARRFIGMRSLTAGERRPASPCSLGGNHVSPKGPLLRLVCDPSPARRPGRPMSERTPSWGIEPVPERLRTLGGVENT